MEDKQAKAKSVRERMVTHDISMSDLQRETILRGLNNGRGFTDRAVRYVFDDTPYRINTSILDLAEDLIREKAEETSAIAA